MIIIIVTPYFGVTVWNLLSKSAQWLMTNFRSVLANCREKDQNSCKKTSKEGSKRADLVDI